MPVNTGFLSGRNGILRILTIVIGIIALGLTADGYLKSLSKEEYLLAMVIICFIGSLIWTALFIFEILAASEQTKMIDIGFHIIGGLLLLIGGIVWLVSVVEIENNCKAFSGIFGCYKTGIRYTAGVFGILDGIVYLVLGALLIKS